MLCISPAGLELIRRFEGLRLTAYRDVADVWTIGYGHTGDLAKPGMTISEAVANKTLWSDADSVATRLSPLIDSPISQSMADALISFAFNVGTGAFRASTARRRLNEGDYLGAAQAMMWWNKATENGQKVTLAGLLRRRAAEVELFLRALPKAA